MPEQRLDGRQIAKKMIQAIQKNLEHLPHDFHSLSLATVVFGQSNDTQLYLRSIENVLKQVSIRHVVQPHPNDISEKEILKSIRQLNEDPNITGILVLNPLPSHVNRFKVLHSIAFHKDVEGRRLLQGMGERIVSPIAMAVMALIDETGIKVEGKEAVIVGHSDIVGKPVSILLLDRMATTTVCHAKTKDLVRHINQADILVTAVGKPHIIKGDWIKEGAVVIDVGENTQNGQIVGDVEYEIAKKKALFITPVPSGVGPITTVMLVQNLISLYRMREIGAEKTI